MKITINLIDEVYCVIPNLKPDHIDILYEKFGFFTPSYRWDIRYKLRKWDGKLRFFQKTGKTYINLLDEILPLLKRWGYKIDINDRRTGKTVYPDPIDNTYLSNIVKDGSPIILEPHQVAGINALFEEGYGIALAATGAGKTFMCAAMLKRYQEYNCRGMIIVPDLSLVNQTRKELVFCEIDTGIFSGGEKDLNHIHLVSTWQTLQNNPHILEQYDIIIIDECHGAKSSVLGKMLREHGKHTSMKFGVTGTLPKNEADLTTVISVLGPVRYTIPAHKLIEKQWLSNLHIHIIQFEMDLTEEYEKYLEDLKSQDIVLPPPTYKQFKKIYFTDWNIEKSYLAKNHARMQYIADIVNEKAAQDRGNFLCLVNNIPFGKKITELTKDAEFLYGQIDVEDRQLVYDQFKVENNMKVYANAQIAATGLNIPRIYNMGFIDMGKSFIRTIQSIGRGLRRAPDKEYVDVYDFCSDTFFSKKHLAERKKYYKEAKYPFTEHTIKL